MMNFFTVYKLVAILEQREGMGMLELEHQAISSFRDELLADGCVHLLYKSCWKFHQLAAKQLLSGQQVQ